MKAVWKSDDGKIFNSEIECLEYETTNALKFLIKQTIKTEFSDDAGFGIIEEHNVADFIETYFDDIVKIMNAKNSVKKVCKNKVDGVCQNHNLQCDYPNCEK